ncbi:tripartite tricarboxylate transporter TctB family protein [Hominifimenecus sp. rT4P-3]|uniref:tripartite tricarboxylate transporter TctB family protein n=1 Tax=Hominifimenecus sp. rT4P-3 TaxID=3242979 RepID=UPI003DA34359
MEISKRKLSLAVDGILIVLSVGYFVLSFFIEEGANFSLSSSFYPRLLAILIFVLSLISLYADTLGSRKTETGTVKVGNPGKQGGILLTTILFVLAWQMLGVFYPMVFVTTGVLVWLYNQEPKSMKKLIKTLLVAAAFTLFVILLFGIGLKIEFT